MGKGGRPKSTNKDLTVSITTRLAEDEAAALDRKSGGRARSAAVRLAVLAWLGMSAALISTRAYADVEDRVVQLMASTEICQAQIDRTVAIKAIAKVKKYASLGGVFSLHEMKGLQEDVEAADDRAAATRQRLASYKMPQLSCSSKNVVSILNCAAALESNLPDEKCDGEVLEFVKQLESSYLDSKGE